MAVWFSASAVVPALVAEFHLSNFAQAALTSGVQVGFVIGCLVSAFLGLPDRVDPRRLFAASAAVARARQRRLAGRRSGVDRRAAAARDHRHRHGRRLSGRHEARDDLGARRHGADGRHPRRRADARLGVAASVQRLRRRRLALRPSCCRRRARWPPRSAIALAGLGPNRKPAPRFEPRCDAAGMARRPAAARQPRLPRAHVGALRDVGVDRRVPERELRPFAAAGRRRRSTPGWRRSRPSAPAHSAASSRDSSPTGSAARR